MKYVYQVVVKRGYYSDVFGDFEFTNSARCFAETYLEKIKDKDVDNDDAKPVTDCYIRIVPVIESEVTDNGIGKFLFLFVV